MAKKTLSQATYADDNVQQLPVQVKGQASLIQQTFDKGTLDQKTYNNNTLLAELQSETLNDSGAHAIGIKTTDSTETNVADQIQKILEAGSGSIPPDGTITNSKLATDVKVGSLAALFTNDKTEVVKAVNENVLSRLVHDDSGLVNAYVVNTPGTFARVDGNTLSFKPLNTNTGASTINEDSNGVANIEKFDVDSDSFVSVEEGDLPKNTRVDLTWNVSRSAFQLAPKGAKINGQDIISGVLQETINANDPVYMDRIINTRTKLANPSTLPTNTGEAVAFSKDGNYMAVGTGTSTFLYIYKRTGDTFTKLADPSVLPTNRVNDIDFSYNGDYMAVSSQDSTRLYIYKRSGDTFTKLADPSVLPTGVGQEVEFSDNGDGFLAIAHSTSPYVTIYSRSGDVFTKLSNPSTLPPSTGYGCSFSKDTTHLAISSSGTPNLIIYKINGTTFTKIADPSTLPVGTVFSCDFSRDGKYLATGSSTSPYVNIYIKIDENEFLDISGISISPTGSVDQVAFSEDSLLLSAAHTTSPFVTMYRKSPKTNTFTKLSNPAILPPSTGHSCNYGRGDNDDDEYLIVGHSSSPYFTIYKNTFNYQIYKSTNIFDLEDTNGAGYLKSSGVATETKNMVRIFRVGG